MIRKNSVTPTARPISVAAERREDEPIPNNNLNPTAPIPVQFLCKTLSVRKKGGQHERKAQLIEANYEQISILVDGLKSRFTQLNSS